MIDLMDSAAVADVEATFDSISKLYDAHHQFVVELTKTASDWSPETSVGSHLKTLVSVVFLIYCHPRMRLVMRLIGSVCSCECVSVCLSCLCSNFCKPGPRTFF